MLYLAGTIARNDGKRMTRKSANAVFDEFLVWLGETQACGFVGCFDPAYRYGNHYTVPVKRPDGTSPRRKPSGRRSDD